MVVDRGGERHQHAADADRAQLGQGRGAGAAHDQVGPGVGGGHVADEGFDAGGDAGLGIGLGRLVAQFLAALVAHVELRAERGQRARQRLVQGARALAAAEHQQAHRAVARGEALRRRRQRGDLGAHRIAHRFLARGEAARESGQHAPCDARQHLVGQARGAVLFVHQQRQFQQARGDATRAGRETAEADHRARRAPAQHEAGGTDRAHDPQRRAEQRQRALAAQPADLDGVDLDAVLRHQLRFHAPGRAQPHHRHAARAQHLGHRQRREDVPAGAAGQDHHRARRSVGHSGAGHRHGHTHPSLPKVGSTRGCMRLVPRAGVPAWIAAATALALASRAACRSSALSTVCLTGAASLRTFAT